MTNLWYAKITMLQVNVCYNYKFYKLLVFYNRRIFYKIFPRTMASSPVKPLTTSFKILSLLIGHLFDVDKLKSSEGIVFEKGHFTTFRVVIFFLAAFGIYIVTPFYCLISKTRYSFYCLKLKAILF